MLECPLPNKKALSLHKKDFSKNDTLMPHSNMTLDQALISKDVISSEYWNEQCKAIQSSLWLPHRIESQEADSPLSSKSSNFMVEKLSSWKNLISPKILTPQHSLLFSLATAIPKVENAIVNVTKKIRVYPSNQQAIFDLLSASRRGYNLAIAIIKEDKQAKLLDVRRTVKAQVKEEWQGRFFQAEIVGEAVRHAFATRSDIIKRRMRGEKCDYKFQSIKQSIQSFVQQRLNKKFCNSFALSEDIPEDSLGRTTTISWERGRWFINAITKIAISEGSESQRLRMAAVDPGVRTFATVFSTDKVVEYGKGFQKNEIMPLLQKLDGMYSTRKLFLNSKPNRDSQVFKNTMRMFQKRIFKISNRVQDLIDDLHRRVAFDLVDNFDVILLPTFEVSDMVEKDNRVLSNKGVRAMLGLKHYQFKVMLKWMCKKYGKTFIDVNEAWTSKTASWNGEIVKDLGGRKRIRSQNKVVDRDVNGARGILIRALSMGSFHPLSSVET